MTFKKDDRVRSTQLALDNGAVRRECFGRVVSDQRNPGRVSVVIDGNRTATGFHTDFWEKTNESPPENRFMREIKAGANSVKVEIEVFGSETVCKLHVFDDSEPSESIIRLNSAQAYRLGDYLRFVAREIG